MTSQGVVVAGNGWETGVEVYRLDILPERGELLKVGKDQVHGLVIEEGVLAFGVLVGEVGEQGLLDVHEVNRVELLLESLHDWRV